MAAPEPSPDAPRSGPRLRLIVAVFAGLAAMLVAWYFLALRQDYAVLYSDLRSPEAAAVVEELEKQGVRYRLRDGGAEVLVPASQADAVRLQLASSDTPPLNGLQGFELFNDADIGLNDFAQKIRYQRALQGELARTIMAMDGVAEARVHISMPERTLFRGERRNAEAAVTLVMRSPDEETQSRVEGVQRLVAASVADLAVADVIVLNGRGEMISPRVDINEAAINATTARDQTATIELVMDIMRRTLPNRLFEVSIEQTPAALAGPPYADGEPSASSEPARVVTVKTPTPLTMGEMERASDALRRAGVVDGSSGGTLSFRVGPPPIAPAASASADTRGVSAPLASTQRGFLELGPIWIVALALLLGGGAALRWWLTRPRLSLEEHKSFADRLKAGLQPREHGRSGA